MWRIAAGNTNWLLQGHVATKSPRKVIEMLQLIVQYLSADFLKRIFKKKKKERKIANCWSE